MTAPVLMSTLDREAPEAKARFTHNASLAADLRASVAAAALGGSEGSRERHVGRGKLLPRERVERLLDPAVSRYPLAWLPTYARKMRDMFGGDPFPYGIEENRATWEQMALYTFQQGIAHRQFKPEEIFPRGMMTKVVI